MMPTDSETNLRCYQLCLTECDMSLSLVSGAHATDSSLLNSTPFGSQKYDYAWESSLNSITCLSCFKGGIMARVEGSDRLQMTA